MNKQKKSDGVAATPELEVFKEPARKLDVTLIEAWLAEHYTGSEAILVKDASLTFGILKGTRVMPDFWSPRAVPMLFAEIGTERLGQLGCGVVR